MFPDKLPVNARDISTGVYQCRRVDDFEGMQGSDQLNGDTHRFTYLMLIQVWGHTLQERKSSALKQVSHSKILIQPERNSSYSFVFFVVFNFLELRELFFFSGMLNTGFLGEVRESWASRCHMSTFAATKTKSFLGALFMFFWSVFLGEFDHVNIHSIGVFGCSRG